MPAAWRTQPQTVRLPHSSVPPDTELLKVQTTSLHCSKTFLGFLLKTEDNQAEIFQIGCFQNFLVWPSFSSCPGHTHSKLLPFSKVSDAPNSKEMLKLLLPSGRSFSPALLLKFYSSFKSQDICPLRTSPRVCHRDSTLSQSTFSAPRHRACCHLPCGSGCCTRLSSPTNWGAPRRQGPSSFSQSTQQGTLYMQVLCEHLLFGR